MKIAVLGNVFVDYKGWVKSTYDPQGRNQGVVEVLHGGVARNVAENMSCLGVPIELVTTLAHDSISEMLASRLQKNGVGLKYVTKHTDAAVGMWLAIIGRNGELLSSVTQLPNVDLLEELVLEQIETLSADVTGVAMDIDLTPRIADCVVAACNKKGLKFYALPGNLTVIGANPYLFSHMDCFICNDIEAAKLLDKSINPKDIEGAQLVAKYFCHQFRLKRLVITLGEYGAVYCDEHGNTGHQVAYPVRVHDTTGAGDAFFSATIAGLVQGKTLVEAVKDGAGLASIVISCTENTCHAVTKEELKKFLKNPV